MSKLSIEELKEIVTTGIVLESKDSQYYLMASELLDLRTKYEAALKVIKHYSKESNLSSEEREYGYEVLKYDAVGVAVEFLTKHEGDKS